MNKLKMASVHVLLKTIPIPHPQDQTPPPPPGHLNKNKMVISFFQYSAINTVAPSGIYQNTIVHVPHIIVFC